MSDTCTSASRLLASFSSVVIFARSCRATGLSHERESDAAEEAAGLEESTAARVPPPTSRRSAATSRLHLDGKTFRALQS